MSSSMSSSDLRDLGHGGSFSFSCSESDLNFSSLSHFTDDDEDEDDDESYIEIALDHGRDANKPAHDHDEGEIIEAVGEGDYLRISFSSSLLPELTTNTNPTIQDDNIVCNEAVYHQTPSSPTSWSCPLSSSSMESSTNCRGPLRSDGSSRLHRSGNSSKRGRLPPFNRLVNTLLFGLRSSSELPVHADNADLARSRKTSNIRTSVNGGIMKLLFKFKAMNLGAMVASFVKPRQVACDQDLHDQANININNGGRKNKQKLVKPFDKWLVPKKQGKMGTKKSSEVVGGEKSNRVLVEINLSAVRGVLEAIGNSMSTAGITRKERRTRSCPSSIKNSPIHQGFASDQQSKVYVYSRETSIQAAIAHCKTSFEQTSLS